MRRLLSIPPNALTLLIVLVACGTSSVGHAQSLEGGDVQANVRSVTRQGGNEVASGDIVHVAVRSPASGAAFYVSIHGEFLSEGTWRKISAAGTALGTLYKGEMLQDFRDYAHLTNPGSNQLHTVVLFMPYRAGSFAPGPHVQRYVVRIFAADGSTVVQAIALTPEEVNVQQSQGPNGVELIIARKTKTCSARTVTSLGPVEPIPPDSYTTESMTMPFGPDGTPGCGEF